MTEEDEKIARWWNKVRKECCWSGGIEGVRFEDLIERWTPEVVQAIRDVYKAARKTA